MKAGRWWGTNAGQIVGATSLPQAGGGVGYIATTWMNGAVHDLHDLIVPHDPDKPYVILRGALAINERGDIAASGFDTRTRVGHAYLLRRKAPLGRLLEMVRDNGPGKSLEMKLRIIQAYLNARDSQAACALIDGFASHVEAQRAKSIGSVAGQEMLDDANEIAADLGCPRR